MAAARMNLGAEVLVDELPAFLEGARVGLVAHPASRVRTPIWQHTATALQAHPGLRLLRLFGPEHGLYGAAQEGEAVADEHDPLTGLEVVSLYGGRRAPAAEHLEGLDALLFDLQDAGVRCFTYLSTLAECLEVCARVGVRLVVLERPNPLGRSVWGPGVAAGFSSFVGAVDVPFVHGLTLGEIALALAETQGLQDALAVVPMRGYRGEPWDKTGLPWTPPSPNLPSLESARLYPATVFLEGTNLSEGRGTAQPFQQVGAPWLDGAALAADLSGVPGIQATEARFTPARSKHAGQEVSGVRLEPVGDFNPTLLGLALIRAAHAQAPERFEWLRGPDGRFFLDLLYGGAALREAVAAGRSLPPAAPARLPRRYLYS